MKKQKVKLIDDVQFDNVQYAKDKLAESEALKAKCQKGMKIALAATICSAIWFILMEVNPQAMILQDLLVICLFASIILSIVSYIVGGGILFALKLALKLCGIGWYIIPIYLVDIFVALLAFVMSLIIFFFVPIIFVGINYRQICKTYDAANEYLSYCKPVNQ